MVQDGFNVFIEIAPGKVLQGLIKNKQRCKSIWCVEVKDLDLLLEEKF